MGIGQALKITLKDYGGRYSRFEFLPYAIWHNQKTGLITIHTENGYFRFPAEVVDRIELLQCTLTFEGSSEVNS